MNNFNEPYVLNNNAFNNANIIITKDKLILNSNGKFYEKENPLNNELVKKQISMIGYIGKYSNRKIYMSRDVENMNLPYMSFAYYYFIFKNEKIPSLEEYMDTYYSVYCNVFSYDEKKMVSIKQQYCLSGNIFVDKNFIDGRLYRAYYSFHREIQLLTFLSSFDLFQDVRYDFNNDIKNGIDILVTYNNNVYGIRSYMYSDMSNGYVTKKENNRHEYTSNDINLIAYFPPYVDEFDERINCESVNGVYLYSYSSISRLIWEIIKIDEQKSSLK